MDDLSIFAFVESGDQYEHDKRPLARFGEKPKRSKYETPRKVVHISAAHHQNLVTLAGLPRLNGVALGTLLDNILTVFFEDYGSNIRAEVKLLPNQFPSTDTPG